MAGGQSEKQETEYDHNLLPVAFDQRSREFLTQLENCQKAPTEESVHFLRVASRRLITLLDLIQAVNHLSEIGKIRKKLAELRNRFTKLRDLQVMILKVSEVKELFPETDAFLSFLEKQVKKLSKDTQKSIAALKPRELENDLNIVKKVISRQLNTDTELKKPLIKCASNSFKAARRRLNHIDSTQPVTIHALRIDFRKFRYQMEIIHPMLPNYPKENLERMTQFQNKMGEVQNLGVLLQKLNSFKKKNQNAQLESVIGHFTRQHQEAINTFISCKDELNLFWRLDRKSAFPWEM